MLMTVLRGDLATQQSRALIRVFRAMKDFIVETQGLVTQRDLLRLSIQTAENTLFKRAHFLHLQRNEE